LPFFRFGIEFRIPLIVAEGFAMAALQEDKVGIFLNPRNSVSRENEHVLDILAEMGEDRRFGDLVQWEDSHKFDTLVEKGFGIMREYLNRWSVQATEKDVKRKEQELYTCIVLLYAAATRPNKSPRFNFSIAHCLTSFLSVHVILQHLPTVQQAILLQAHFSTTLLHYISNGCPVLFVNNLKAHTPALPPNPNPWIEVIKFAIRTPDVHAMKVIRSLWLAESLYGENEGIFLKAAEVTADSFQDAPEDPTDLGKAWDEAGVGFDETWENVPFLPAPISGSGRG